MFDYDILCVIIFHYTYFNEYTQTIVPFLYY